MWGRRREAEVNKTAGAAAQPPVPPSAAAGETEAAPAMDAHAFAAGVEQQQAAAADAPLNGAAAQAPSPALDEKTPQYWRGKLVTSAELKQPNGQAVPAALVLWARVSAEVDARLPAAPRYPIRLHPNEWQSGDVFWIIDAVGERNAVQQCIEALAKTAFQGKEFKALQAVAGRGIVVSQQKALAPDVSRTLQGDI
ncbi:MAG: toxin-activating lysine-acyltransferase [Rhodomicrobium sp.]